MWGVIVGLPLNSNGTKSTTTQSINAFIKNLSNAINLPIITKDERYSTFFIKNNPVLNNKKNSNKLLDDQSACWVLQNFLDSIKE